MKRKTTKELLAESFRELAETVPIDKITVKDIVYNCDYSPATFYRQFKDKYDLIAYDYVQRTSEIIVNFGTEEYEWIHILTDCMRFFGENRKYMKNLLLHTSGMDSFMRYFADANIGHITGCILKNSPMKELSHDLYEKGRLYRISREMQMGASRKVRTIWGCRSVVGSSLCKDELKGAVFTVLSDSTEIIAKRWLNAYEK